MARLQNRSTPQKEGTPTRQRQGQLSRSDSSDTPPGKVTTDPFKLLNQDIMVIYSVKSIRFLNQLFTTTYSKTFRDELVPSSAIEWEKQLGVFI